MSLTRRQFLRRSTAITVVAAAAPAALARSGPLPIANGGTSLTSLMHFNTTNIISDHTLDALRYSLHVFECSYERKTGQPRLIHIPNEEFFCHEPPASNPLP